MAEKFFEDFDFFWDLIINHKNFSFARYADGEIMLMKGQPVGNLTQAYMKDKWSSNGGKTKLGVDLINSLSTDHPDFYFAISSKTDDVSDYDFLNHIIKNKDNITFANLWINANYKNTMSNVKKLKRDVVLICNEICELKNIPFNVIEFLPFPNDCVNFWENHRELYLEKLSTLSSKYNDTLFIICCGPASAVIVKNMFDINIKNTYIDFGSSLDSFIHNKITRPYMESSSEYHNHISKF